MTANPAPWPPCDVCGQPCNGGFTRRTIGAAEARRCIACDPSTLIAHREALAELEAERKRRHTPWVLQPGPSPDEWDVFYVGEEDA